MSNAVIVIPHHLPTLDFLLEWEQLKPYEIIVVQDIGKKPPIPEGFNVTIYDHKDIEADLGENAWIIPAQTSACRSYGYYKAWQRKPEYILTLDNDCFPDKSSTDWVNGHIKMMNMPATLDWWESNELIEFTRGYPYLIRNESQVWLNHGLWSKVPDLDAATWLQDLAVELPPYAKSHVIPRYNFTPICGMNLAWRAELTPALYFGLFGPEYGFDQYDDIWGGILAKKVLDHLGYAMRSGYPSVQHRKQSNVFTNLKKQAPGLAMNEHFWRAVQQTHPSGETVVEVYQSIIDQLPDTIEEEPHEDYFIKYKKATRIWISLYAKA
jgi:hypothetical protein